MTAELQPTAGHTGAAISQAGLGPSQPGLLRRQWSVWRRKPIGFGSLLFIVFLLVVAAAGPALATHDPLQNDLRAVLAGPSADHFFGTDSNGRDVYSRIVHGARLSLFVGFASVIFGITGAVVVGLVSGYAGGTVDYLIQRVTDAVMAIPGLILLLALVSVLEPSLLNLVIALCIVVMPGTIRVVRAEVLVAKEYDYVLAAHALGASSRRIVVRHVLPNVMAPILILGSVVVGTAILIEASLSFLGLGVPPPAPTWGNMLSGPNRQYMASAPWLVIFPGLAITLAVLAFNMLGDALRDIFDPRLRGR